MSLRTRLCFVCIAVLFGLALSGSARALPCALLVLPLLLGGRDARKEWAQQAAFEEAERLRAEQRAGAMFDCFVDSSPVSIEIYDAQGKLLKCNKASERLLGKMPPPGFSLFEERGLTRAGLLEPQLKRVLAGTRVETPPVWYDPTEVGLPGIPGKKVCFRATVFPIFDAESNVTEIAVIHEDVTELHRLEESTREAGRRQTDSGSVPVSEDVRELEFRRRKTEKALRETEEKYRAFIEGQRSCVTYEMTEDGRISSISPSVEEIWGVSAGTVQADPSVFLAQVHVDDREFVRDAEAEIRKSGVYPEQYRFRVENRKTGAVHWVEVRGSVSRVGGKKAYHAIAIDVSHFVAVEQTLTEKTRMLETVLSNDHDGVALIDPGLTVTLWSKAAERETRLTQEETVGKLLTEVYPEFAASGFLGIVKESLDKRSSLRHEAFYSDSRDRLAGWYEVTTYPWDSGLLLRIRNTTQAKNVEQSLKAKQRDLDSFLENPNDALVVLDRNLVVVSWNEPAERETRLAARETVGRKLTEVYPELEKAGFLAPITESLSKRVSLRHEALYSDGRDRLAGWYEVTIYPWETGLLLRVRNTTKSRALDQSLKAKQADFEALLGSEADGIILLDKELTVTRWNDAAEKETRLTARETVGRKITEVYPEFSSAGFLASIRESISKRAPLRHEAFYSDGRERQSGWFSIASYPLAAGVLLMVRNMTGLKKAEQAWVDADSRLRALLESPGVAVATKDRDLRYTMANQEAVRMLGLAAGRNIVGKSDEELLKPAVADLLVSNDRRVLSEGKPVELELALPDAASRNAAWYRVTKSPLHLPGQAVSGILVVATEITRRINVQEELGRCRKLVEDLLKKQTRTFRKVEKEIKRWEGPGTRPA